MRVSVSGSPARSPDGESLRPRSGVARERAADVLLQALAERHPDLSGHVSKVGRLVEAVALRLGVPDDATRVLRSAAELHHIGKVAIPDAIIAKPARSMRRNVTSSAATR